MFWGRKDRYDEALKAADAVRQSAKELRRAMDEHHVRVDALLGELVPTPGGGGNNREDDDVSMGE